MCLGGGDFVVQPLAADGWATREHMACGGKISELFCCFIALCKIEYTPAMLYLTNITYKPLVVGCNHILIEYWLLHCEPLISG